MRGIVLVSHGELAKGMLHTLGMFTSDMEQIEAVSLMPEADLEKFLTSITDAINNVDKGEGATVFVDLLFGTPSNTVARLLNSEDYKERVTLITGMNLPMLIEYSMLRDDDFDKVLENGKDGIVDFKKQYLNK